MACGSMSRRERERESSSGYLNLMNDFANKLKSSEMQCVRLKFMQGKFMRKIFYCN